MEDAENGEELSMLQEQSGERPMAVPQGKGYTALHSSAHVGWNRASPHAPFLLLIHSLKVRAKLEPSLEDSSASAHTSTGMGV